MEINGTLKIIRLVPEREDPARRRIRNIERTRLPLDVRDEIQLRMNGGYSLGATRVHHDDSIDYLDIRYDGEKLCFKPREEGWKPSERLLAYEPAQESRALKVLTEIATRHEYKVELVELVEAG